MCPFDVFSTEHTGSKYILYSKGIEQVEKGLKIQTYVFLSFRVNVSEFYLCCLQRSEEKTSFQKSQHLVDSPIKPSKRIAHPKP
jgi:hypothetical protein